MNNSDQNIPEYNHDAPLAQRIFRLGMLLRRAECCPPGAPADPGERGEGSAPDAPGVPDVLGAPGGRGHRGFGHHVYQGQGRALAILAMRSPIAQRELAYLLGVRPQSLGEVLAKLENAGLITREVDPNDARARLVAITDEGKQQAKKIENTPQFDALDVLSDEEKTHFLELLERVTVNLEETVGAESGFEQQRGHHRDGHRGHRGGHGRGGGRGRGFGRGFRPDFGIFPGVVFTVRGGRRDHFGGHGCC